MDNFIQLLESQSILDHQTIMRLRTHIENKHAEKSKLIKAELLANHINKIIDSHLHNTLKEEKLNIRSKLIEILLTSEIKSITKRNVFDQIIEQPTTKNKLNTLAKKWLTHEGSSLIPEDIIARYIAETRDSEFASDNIISSNSDPQIIQPAKIKSNLFNPKKLAFTTSIFLVICSFLIYVNNTNKSILTNKAVTITINDIQNSINNYKLVDRKVTTVGLPHYFKYRNISKTSLTSFLNSKNSLLSDDQNLNIILKVADEYQINPLLLIAIAGQEQGYVPRKHQQAQIIVNNPYNVYGSWRKYNTNLSDSTAIAAGTIQKILSDRPPHIDPFIHLNNTYAEDNQWWIGVKRIFRQLNEL